MAYIGLGTNLGGRNALYEADKLSDVWVLPVSTGRDGHGAQWKRKCLEIGAEPKRCYGDAEVISPPRRIAPWEIGCTRCGSPGWRGSARCSRCC